MNVLILQERSATERNDEFRECLSLQRAFQALGHKAIVWGPRYDTYSRPLSDWIREEAIDVLFLMENYDTGWVPELKSLPCLRVMWSIDSHCHLRQHVRLADRQQVHVLLNATEGYLKHFAKAGRRCLWFPNCYDDTLVRPLPNVPKTIHLGYCGSWGNRRRWIDFLVRKRGLKKDIQVLGPDMVAAVNSYRIHFNRNQVDDINYRTFETLGCKTLLLTNYTPGLERLFDLQSDLVVYDRQADLIEKIDYYLAHDELRLRTASRGHERVRRDHTYLRRVQQFIEICS